jgi:alpha-1,6-mannosyltransferase
VRPRPTRPAFGVPWEADPCVARRPSDGRDAVHILDATMLYAPGSGGVARYLREKRAWLARNTTIRHTLVVPAARDGVGPYGEILVRTRALTRSAYRWPWHASRWVREMRARAPDLIEAGDPGPLGWMALSAARQLGVPLLAFCHSDVVRLVAHRLSPPVAAIVRRYAATFYRRCDVVVVPSEYMKARLTEWGVEQVVVRPLGVDVATFTPAAREPDLRRQLALPRDSRVLVYAGRFAPEKHIGVLLEAFRRLGGRYHLVLAGAGAELRRQANVTHVPYVESARDLAHLLASADGLVHAGDQEAFGLIVLEAMACGRGVIAPAAGALPELIGTDAGVLVAPRDAGALAEGIRAFYATGCEALGARARRRVEQSFTWNIAMRGMLGVYRAALARTPVALPTYAPS